MIGVPPHSAAATGEKLVELLYRVVDGERCRFLAWWKLFKRLQELSCDGRAVEHQEDAIQQPIPVCIRRYVCMLVRIGPQIEQLRRPQLGEGLKPNLQRARAPLLHEDD